MPDLDLERMDMPALVAEVEKLRAENADLREQVRDLTTAPPLKLETP